MIVKAGSVNVSVYYYIVQDASGTSPGEPVTGLLFSDIETGGSASFMRQGAARVDLTLITLASASATHADGGFILVDDTNMPGLYRCDYPDAAFVTGVDQTFCQIVVASANNAVAAPILIDIDDSVDQTGDSFGRIGVNGAGLTNVTVGTNNDKTGYTLSQSFPSNFSSMVISGAGAVDSLVQGYLNTTLTESSVGRINNNIEFFYDNADAQTTQVVDDVGDGTLLPSAGWLWSTSTSGVPNPGRLRGNNATIASITELSIHQETADGKNAGIVISALRSGDKVGIFFEANPDVFLIFDVTATPILTGSVYAVTGTVDSTSGSFANTSVTVSYLITGNTESAVANRQEMDSNSTQLAKLGNPASTSISADNADIKTVVDAIPTTAMRGTDIGDLNNISAADVLAAGDADGFSLEESLKLLLSASTGVLAGAATNTITIQAADGSKTRLTATVDVDGNRSVVVKDATG